MVDDDKALVERLREGVDNDGYDYLVEMADADMREAADRIEALSAENERLASFIMHCIEGEPSQSQGAVDTAIRIMTEQATTIGEQLAENERLREALAIAAVWTAEPETTIADIRAALGEK